MREGVHGPGDTGGHPAPQGEGRGAVRLPVVPDGRVAVWVLHEGGGDIRERGEGLARGGEEETREIQ